MPHYVKPTIDGDWTGMEFTCDEPETANCRLRCPAGESCEEFTVEWIDGKPWHVGYKYDDETDEETDGPLHEMSTGNQCGVIEFDALNECYAGEPTTLREGPVTFVWGGDFYEWTYAKHECVWGQGECLPNCPDCKRMDDLYAERAEGVNEEARRVKAIILDHYKVAPKAAAPLLRLLGYETETPA